MKILLLGFLILIIIVSGCVSETTNINNDTLTNKTQQENQNISNESIQDEQSHACEEIDNLCCIGVHCSNPITSDCVFMGCDEECRPLSECAQEGDNQTQPVEIKSDPQDDPNYIAAQPDPDFDNFTWTLPTGASDIRLSLMADIDDFLFNEYGSIGGWGKHGGGHVEGLDHAWIELKPGTPVKSMADGVVRQVSQSEEEYHIYIDYSSDLMGIHMEVMTPYVEKGDVVTRGQEIGLGMSFDPHQSSGEMALIDRGRTDGVLIDDGLGGSYVSVFDYLEDDDKRLLVDTYKEKVIEPYLADGSKAWEFGPEEPYLTNKLFLHDGNEGKIVGTWYLISQDWEYAYPSDIITFIERENEYFEGKIVRGIDDEDIYDGEWYFDGTYEVDYSASPHTIKIVQEESSDYFGIFEITENNGAEYGYEEDRATLKIEYKEGSYPSEFSDNALIYIERTNKGRRSDL